MFASYGLIVHLLVIIAIYGILSLSLNLVLGVTGLFSIAHAAFYGVGAYTSALLTMRGIPWVVAMPAGMVLAGIVAYIIGIPTVRLVGDYLAVVTLGLGEIARAVFRNWISVTRGPMGLPGIPSASIFGFTFGTAEQYLVLAAICLLVVYVICQRLLSSPFGRVLKAIREDQRATLALGKNVDRFKMWSFVIGAAMAGLAGSLFAHYIGFIDPSSFVMWLTFFLFLIIVLGGLGNNLGTVLATVVFVAAREGLRFVGLPDWINPAALQQFVFGMLLVVVTLFKPEGLIPARKVTYRRYRQRVEG